MEQQRAQRNSGGGGKNPRGDQQGIAGQEKADKETGFDKNDATNERRTAGADEFLQSFRVKEGAEKMEKRFKHATWFLFGLASFPWARVANDSAGARKRRRPPTDIEPTPIR